MQCTNCNYRKTLAKSGMYFINMCHECFNSIAYISEEPKKCLNSLKPAQDSITLTEKELKS